MTPSSTPLLTRFDTWYRGFIQGKTRIVSAWIVAILVGLMSREMPPAPAGIIICFIGASLRFWASGYLRKDSKISVGGPYGMTRNPLYLGTYLMAIGTAWAAHQLWLTLIVSAFFAVLYHYVILFEETNLRKYFGPAYEQYLTLVPRFLPRPWPRAWADFAPLSPPQEGQKFSWEVAKKNKAFEAYYSWIGLIAYVWIMAWIWSQV